MTVVDGVWAAAARGLLRRTDGDVLVLRDGGEETTFGSGGELHVEIDVHDPRVYGRTLRHGSIGFGGAYIDGWWDSPDVVDLLRVLHRRTSTIDRWRLSQVASGVRARRSVRSAEQERRNVAAHYDVGNEFFAAWLDPSMAYSCARFDVEGADLAEAQRRKLDMICDRLELTEGDHLLDIGCGWGSLIFHAAHERGCRATGLTTSAAQHRHVCDEIARRGVAGQVEVHLEDVRDHQGRYDAAASIEMIEALSGPHHQMLYDAIARLVRPGGRAVVQAIVIVDDHYETAQVRPDFIREVIFPGGSLPSRGSIDDHLRRARLDIVDRLEMGDHYPPTLAAWRSRLTAASESIAPLGFDERDRRRWAFYLAYCEAGFLEEHIGVVNDLLRR